MKSNYETPEILIREYPVLPKDFLTCSPTSEKGDGDLDDGTDHGDLF